MFRRLNIAIFVAVLSVQLLTAQMRGGMGGVAGLHGSFAHGVRGGVGLHRARHRIPGGIFPSSPFLYSDYDPNESYVDENSLGSVPPQILVVRPASEDSARKTPLLIELQGDRYVRFGGIEETGEHGAAGHPDYAEPAKTSRRPPANLAKSSARKDSVESPAEELPPAVLVYRDGHREEISDYVISNGVIYVRGNYSQAGYWTKNVSLSALDQAATVQANQQRGVKFTLPSAPNVVVASF
jgi:hypothetical protein